MSPSLERYSEVLREREPGVWAPRAAHPAGDAGVHYPEEGHALCGELEDESFWFRHRNRVILAAVRRFPPPGPLFDVGGGNGHVSLALERAGWQPVLVEPGAEGVRRARERGLSPVVHATLAEAGFRAGSLPAIGMFDVLEHLEDDRAVLADLHGLLAPGGRLYLTVPAYPLLWSADDRHARHQRRYRLGGLRSRCREAGLSVLAATYFFVPLPLPILLLRTLPDRLSLSGPVAAPRSRREHRAATPTIRRVLEAFLAVELRLVERGFALPSGSSCLVVAEKRA